ncbi:MAG TPA: DNA polymerase III subunit alpha [Lutibacter sp.]|nr:DNA polymerase III subunit alpha [Lutibacter sp.]
MYLIFDTETTGLPKNFKAPITDTDNWPRCVQIAWQLHDEFGNIIDYQDYLIQPDGYNIPFESEQIHGISTQLVTEKGTALTEVLTHFNAALDQAKFVVGQNINFDLNIMGSEFYRMGIETELNKKPKLDTCTETTARLCQIPGGRGGKYKLPTLTELHQHLFNTPFSEAHNATADVEATTRCFFELIRQQVFTASELQVTPDYFNTFSEKNPKPIPVAGIQHTNLKKESQKLKNKLQEKEVIIEEETAYNPVLETVSFSHLHNHSQFSILESTASTSDLIQNAIKMEMPAVAISDLGNMMGAFNFVQEAIEYNKKIEEENENLEQGKEPKKTIIPIVGSEFNVCDDHTNKKVKDNGHRVVLLAKNKKGYQNLTKLSSISHTDGFYYVPRIDKKLLLQYKDNLIALSGSLHGEIPNKILTIGEKQAEEALVWWKESFQDDFYLEIMRHGLETEDHVNDIIVKFARQYQVKLIATNNTYFINQEDAEAQDILVCVKEGEQQSTPKGRGRGYRRGLDNDSYYFKSQDEMKKLFSDIPESIINIQEVVDKVEVYELARKVLLPKFVIPTEFEDPKDKEDKGVRGENAYLKHLTFKGAEKRWGELTDEIVERLYFELETISNSGYPGYFLIVWDLILEARKMGVSVGPGRGSAAGSAVAYCLWITNIDPIKYDLLFERFLNPERVSMPDIDIDFDDEGRQKVIDYTTNKYGQKNVAQIITYGTLGAKSSIRDTGRVMELPLHETDRIAKLLPLVKLDTIFNNTEKNKQKIKELREEERLKINELKNIAEGEDLEAITIQQAQKIEGSVRNTGVHACGFIITPEEITNLIPIATAKDSDMYVTQFDNSVVESAGLLKMDFLGLKTLTLIKDTLEIIEVIHGEKLDADEFPLEDEKTYELFQKGETIGIFQFESVGMRKSLKDLKPTEFADLIAMVALYRPGPMDYIPLFIERKHGISEIEYDVPIMEDILKETYGVTVYQEQVMRLSQILADFSKGDADVLRKAMGKKQIAVLNKMKAQFIEGGIKNKHPEDKLEKIWKDWEKFASYAFNKSHATCYAFIAFQTAYLKAHYPAEFMAATLSNNMNDIKKVTFYMAECRHSGIPVLGPDINESWHKFAVNTEGAIRFGMGAIKGVGQGAVESIVNERKKNGKYNSIFDFAKRINLRAANKRVFEGLALSGGFDSFTNTHRAQYFAVDEKGKTFIDKAIKFGNRFQEDANSSQMSLFGGDSEQTTLSEPAIPFTEEWTVMEKLSKEKSVVGIYISGHPLDDYKNELKYFCNAHLGILQDQTQLLDRDLSFGGIITSVTHRVSKNGKGWGLFTVEDYTDSFEFRMFGEEYLRFKHFLVVNSFIHIRLKIIKGWKEGETRMRFSSLRMLQDILENQAKKISLQFSIKELNKKLIAELADIIKMYKGKKEIDFVVYEMKEQLKLHMLSRKYKIGITNDLLQVLKEKQWNFILK